MDTAIRIRRRPLDDLRYSSAAAALLLPLSLALCPAVGAELPDLPLQGRSQIHLASVEEGIAIVGQADVFVQQMGPLERQLRLQTDRPVSADEYLQFVRRQVLEWTPAEFDLLQQLVEQLRPRLERFAPLWPDRVTLVKTTGREESHAPHCRGNAIVLPARVLQGDAGHLQSVLIHELFHILSRQSAQRRAELFEIVGFRAVAPIALPDAWQPRRITNPDAAHVDCVIGLRHQGEQLDVAPVLLTRQDAYPSGKNRTLFAELVFGLMPVEQQATGWQPSTAAQEGKLWQPRELPDYSIKIGRNTSYIIHPEEILADNFVHLVLSTEDLPDPSIVEELAKRLQAPQP